MARKSEIPARLKLARSQKKLSQKQLADLTGIAAPQISRYEKGANTPRFDAASKLAEALDLDVSSIMETDDGGEMDAIARAVQITTSVSPELYSKISESARKNLQPIDAEVRVRLMRSFDSVMEEVNLSTGEKIILTKEELRILVEDAIDTATERVLQKERGTGTDSVKVEKG